MVTVEDGWCQGLGEGRRNKRAQGIFGSERTLPDTVTVDTFVNPQVVRCKE